MDVVIIVQFHGRTASLGNRKIGPSSLAVTDGIEGLGVLTVIYWQFTNSTPGFIRDWDHKL